MGNEEEVLLNGECYIECDGEKQTIYRTFVY